MEHCIYDKKIYEIKSKQGFLIEISDIDDKNNKFTIFEKNVERLEKNKWYIKYKAYFSTINIKTNVTFIVNSNSRNKARYAIYQAANNYISNNNIVNCSIEYKDILVKRYDIRDIFIYNEYVGTKDTINNYLDRETYLEEINGMISVGIKYVHIQRGNYYYTEDPEIYTENINEAAIYDINDAISVAKSLFDVYLIPATNKTIIKKENIFIRFFKNMRKN